jgi:hypothetical protein
MVHLVYILLSPVMANKPIPECVSYALDIVSNIGRTIDITGKKRRYDHDCWLVSLTDDEERAVIHARCTRHFSVGSTPLYRTCTSLLFPRLVYFMKSNDREYVLKALEAFGRLCHVQENVELIEPTECPDLPHLLIELLRVSVTSVEQMLCFVGRSDQEEVANWLSKPAAMIGYFSDQCDVTIRDLSLYAIYTLVCLSLKLRRPIACVPRVFKTLRRIACSNMKSESTTRAADIINVLSMDPANRLELLSDQKDITIAAFMDDAIAGILFSIPFDSCYLHPIERFYV